MHNLLLEVVDFFAADLVFECGLQDFHEGKHVFVVSRLEKAVLENDRCNVDEQK